MYRIARVAVDKTTPQYDKEYDYLVPEGWPLEPGCRVTVPFGVRNQRRTAIVLELLEQEERPPRLKWLATQADRKPILGPEQQMLLRYLKKQTFCSYFDALKVLIPAGVGLRLEEGYGLAPGELPDPETLSPIQNQILGYLAERGGFVPGPDILEAMGLTPASRELETLEEMGILIHRTMDKQKIQDEKLTMVRLVPRAAEEDPPKLTKKQQSVWKLLEEIGSGSVKEVCYFCGVTKAVVERMVKGGLAELYQQEIYRNPYEGVQAAECTRIDLNEEQQQVYDRLLGKLKSGEAETALLYGVTGSGKTQIFLKLVQQVVAAGRQAIVMVPEISLTPQTIEKFHRAFGGRTAVLHSSLTLSQRMDEWKRIQSGEADIVVGTRSAVFAPLRDVGLIVMDEEQEHTYKSESSPRFHAREVAKVRCRWHKSLLLLCSATPSVESYYQAKNGRYQLERLVHRYSGGALPDVCIVDMNREGAEGSLSQRLTEELYHNLQAKEQSILLLNRRGYNTMVKCSSCGEVLTCPNCSVSLTYHSANGRLMCHYCGYSRELPRQCESCGSQMVRYTGAGTQRVEEQLHTLFPEARVLRMDMDTTMSRCSYEEKFSRFAAGEYDIMIGTQMVAKGLNFPKVTLVGVLSADLSLYSDDFRSFEKTFSLLTQVVGRSGRAELPGRAFIQTSSPDNPVIRLAAEQDYEAFYEEEILFRQLNLYPPFCDLVMVGFTGLFEEKVEHAARWFADAFAALARREYPRLPIRVLGPSAAGMYRVAGKYRWKLLIKCRSGASFRELLGRVTDAYYQERAHKDVTAFVDMYYDCAL